MEEKKVKDVMLLLGEYATISCEATIREAILVLSKSQMGLTYDRHHHRAVLALDEDGKVVGKLSHWAILRSLEPRFLNEEYMRSLDGAGLGEEFVESVERFLQSSFQGRLSALCRCAARVKVKDAMVPVWESIDEGATLVEAIDVLVNSHAQSILVSHNGEVIGVLRLSDVFEEVADIIRGGGEK